MSMSAPWTRPGVTIVPKGYLPSSKDDLPEEKLVQKIMQMSFNSRQRASSASTLSSLEAVRRRKPGDASGYPCYPAASHLRPAQLSRQQSWRSGPSRGVLKVTMKSAHGLAAADLEGTSDPYVVVESAGLRRKTEVVYKTLDPTWDQDLVMPGILDGFVETGLVLKVYDWDELGSADPLGEVRVVLTELRSNDHIEFVEKLTRGGRILFSVTWTPANTSSSTSLKWSQSEATLPATPSAIASQSRQSIAAAELPLMPVLLPHKLDWVFLTYQRKPKALNCSERALDSLCALPPKPRVKTRVGNVTTPVLRRPPSASIFVPATFESFR